MEFHEKLQELRKRKNMTQEELAQALYVSRTAISKWESGKGYPSIDSLKAISTFFWSESRQQHTGSFPSFLNKHTTLPQNILFGNCYQSDLMWNSWSCPSK